MRIFSLRKISLLVALILLPSMFLMTTSVEATEIGEKLLVEKEIVSIKLGDSEYVLITALNETGSPESYTVSSTNLYSNVTKLNTSYIEITAGNDMGVDTITITSASGLSETITARVHDPLILDDGSGLLIAYTDQFDWWYDDYETGADDDVSHWMPKKPSNDPKWNDFHFLGGYFKGAKGDGANPDGKDYAIMVKDKNNASLLAKPTSYTKVWDDGGSGGYHDGSVWVANCPSGYVGFGSVPGYFSQGAPSTDVIRCVREELTVQGTVGSWIYDDSGSGASMSYSIWTIEQPDTIASADGKAFLPTNTFVASTSFSKDNVNMSYCRLLHISLPVMESSEESTEPFLTGYHPFEEFKPRFSKSILLPFTVIKDEGHTVAWKVANSPFYSIARKEQYSSLGFYDNRQGSDTVTRTLSYTTGYSKETTDTFSHSYSITIGFEKSFGIVAGGPGAKLSVSFTTTLQWTNSVATTYSTSQTDSYELKIPAGKFSELLQVTGSFILKTGQGLYVDELPMKSSGFKTLEYPPPTKNNDILAPGFTAVSSVFAIGLIVLATTYTKKR